MYELWEALPGSSGLQPDCLAEKAPLWELQERGYFFSRQWAIQAISSSPV